MTLKLGLLFHFNQHLNEMGRLASAVCYTGLLQTLRARPAIKANIQISGTLIHALKWLDDEPLRLIAEGLADGQFCLIGSTYAQNVPYATHDDDNRMQIDLHRQVLDETFGVTPTVFWNAERCWRQSLVPVIAGGGYHTTLIEDHILVDSGAPKAQLVGTRLGGDRLTAVYDDETLKHHFNFAAWFGDRGGLHGYLDDLIAASGAVTAYAEDAEAMGLWGYAQGVDPRQTWARLGELLDSLVARADVEMVRLDALPTPQVEVTPIADGSAVWMNASLAREGLPYHEDGYANWLDFNQRAPKHRQFRARHGEIRRLVRENANDVTEGGRKLRALARQVFLANQYEFGCIGIGSEQGFRGWMGMESARVLALMANWARSDEAAMRAVWRRDVADINADGVEEIVWQQGRWLAVFSPVGGRLLYWADLVAGTLVVGNPHPVAGGAWLGDSYPPEPMARPRLWVPETDATPTPDSEELAPTRLWRSLPAWVWEAYAPPYRLAVREMRWPGPPVATLTAQQRAFCDEIEVDGVLVGEIGRRMTARVTPEGVWFEGAVGEGLWLAKFYRLEGDGVVCDYRLWHGEGGSPRQVTVRVQHEISGDSEAVLRHGRAALQPSADGVVNPLAGVGVRVSSEPGQPVRHSEALLALTVGQDFEGMVRDDLRFTVRLGWQAPAN